MATMLEGSFTVPADIETVWSGLTDPETLRSCITGCDTLVKANDTVFIATAKVKVGFLRTSFKGRVEMHDVDAPNGCRLIGQGEGGIAGFAKGAADVRLQAVSEGTTVRYAVEASVGGKLARLGGLLIDNVAQRIANQFFVAFTAAIAPKQAKVET